MDFLTSLHISGSGLTAQRTRMNVISRNLANAETTRTATGGPYRRKVVVMEQESVQDFDAALATQSDACGVRVTEIVEDKTPFSQVYNPSHPDADDAGFVMMPNINLIVEMTNMMLARRNYEANVTAINAAKGMALKALELGR
ncbi:MAG: flagellar basal body rod protein FlgC [Pseudomonadota bacterium]